MLIAAGEPQAGIGAETSDVSFDGIELADKPHTLFRDRGRAGARDFDQLTAGMGPELSELGTRADATGRNQPVAAGIAIHLKDAAKALQYRKRVAEAVTG